MYLKGINSAKQFSGNGKTNHRSLIAVSEFSSFHERQETTGLSGIVAKRLLKNIVLGLALFGFSGCYDYFHVKGTNDAAVVVPKDAGADLKKSDAKPAVQDIETKDAETKEGSAPTEAKVEDLGTVDSSNDISSAADLVSAPDNAKTEDLTLPNPGPDIAEQDRGQPDAHDREDSKMEDAELPDLAELPDVFMLIIDLSEFADMNMSNVD